MRRVLFDIQNSRLAEDIRQALEEYGPDFEKICSQKPEETADLCCAVRPDILLLEAAERLPWRLEERLRICERVRKQIPGMQIVLVIDENAEKKLTDRVCGARKDGLIDRFIYASASPAYLSAVVDAL